MEPEPNDTTGKGAGRDSAEAAPASNEQIPLARLRDLRPEKDPIGAGSKPLTDTAAKRPNK